MIRFVGFTVLSVITIVKVDAIVNGNVATRKWPFMVSLRYPKEHFCGGSIIGQRWILTAAHCLNKIRDKDRIKVVTGMMNRKTEPNPELVYNVKSIRWHKEYKPAHSNDIGLIYTDRIIRFKLDSVEYINIADRSYDVEGNTVYFAGWGAYKPNGPYPRKLLEIEMKIYGKERCLKRYTTGDDNICAAAGKIKGCCLGDSGGPLVITKGDSLSNGALIGVNSYGLTPCAKYKADFFADVYYHTDWIKNTQVRIECAERNNNRI